MSKHLGNGTREYDLLGDFSKIVAQKPTIRFYKWFLEKYAKSGGNLVDFGCGSGYFLRLAHKTGRFSKLIGVDIHPKAPWLFEKVMKKAEIPYRIFSDPKKFNPDSNTVDFINADASYLPEIPSNFADLCTHIFTLLPKVPGAEIFTKEGTTYLHAFQMNAILVGMMAEGLRISKSRFIVCTYMDIRTGDPNIYRDYMKIMLEQRFEFPQNIKYEIEIYTDDKLDDVIERSGLYKRRPGEKANPGSVFVHIFEKELNSNLNLEGAKNLALLYKNVLTQDDVTLGYNPRNETVEFFSPRLGSGFFLPFKKEWVR